MATVLVSCKLVNGIKFQLEDKDGSIRNIILEGSGEIAKGNKGVPLNKHAFGLTPVDSEDYEEIKKKYAHMTYWKDGIIFSSENKARAKSEQAEKKNVKTGREPVDMNNVAGMEMSVNT